MDITKPPSLHRPGKAYPAVAVWLVVAGLVVAFLVAKRLTQANPDIAREWLKKGALVIDVRSEAEYGEQHLPGTINIPLDRLEAKIGRHATNKETLLLLHCRSGARSGSGTSTLKQMGYRNTLNLGSYGRAASLLDAQGQ